MESNALKQQFDTLQERQQQKLTKLKARSKETQAKEAKLLSSHSFGINDNLDLKLADSPDEAKSIFSEELVNHLNDEIRQLKDETGRLYKLLSERDFEIRQTKKKIDKQQNENGGSNIGSDAAAVKIVDLSKKIRELTSELESERTKSKQLKRTCNDLENKLTDSNSRGPMESSRTITSEASVSANELKSLQEKCKQSEMKLTENRNQNQSLRNELKVLQKVIVQEVGDNISVQTLLSGSSGWRGRAQQIIALQKKVNELKCQLGEIKTKNQDVDLDADIEQQFMGSATSVSSLVDVRGRKTVQRIERQKKEANERMLNEMKALEQDHEALKGKFDASKARNKVLSGEVKSLKQQLATLMDKGKHDDELVSALLKQQDQLKLSIESNTEKQKELENLKKDSMHRLSSKALQENNIVEQLKAIVEEKEAKVHQLEKDLEETRRQKAEEHGMNSIFGNLSRPSTSDSRPQSVIAEIVDCNTSLSNTFVVDPPPLSRQSTLLSDRPSTRNSRPATPNNLALEINELKLQCQEYKSLCQAATVERDRLTELVQVLDARLSELTVSSSDSHAELLQQRKRNAQLEKNIGKVKVEQGSAAAGKRFKAKMSSSVSLRDSLAVDDIGVDLEELEVSLEIQQDENKALKAALQSTLQAKDEDIRMYVQMMNETKAVFLQGLRQYRQTNS